MRLNHLDLNQLLILDALLAERSVTKAAERLHVTQPAVSAALGKMREYFCDELFVPVGRRLVLTAFAERLAKPVRDLLLTAQTITRMRPEVDLASVARSIKIAASDFVASLLLAPILRQALLEAPLIHFELVSVLDSRLHYHEDLDRGEVDLLIVPEIYASDEHPKEALFSEHYACIACKSHPIAARGLTVSDYLALGHVSVTTRTARSLPYDEMQLQKLGYTRRIEAAVPTFSMIPDLLVGTPRIATVHARMAQSLAQRWPLQVIPCPIPIPPLIEVVQWHRYQERDPAILWLRQQLHDLANSLPPDGQPQPV